MKTLPRNFKTELMYENSDTHQSKTKFLNFLFLKAYYSFKLLNKICFHFYDTKYITLNYSIYTLLCKYYNNYTINILRNGY